MKLRLIPSFLFIILLSSWACNTNNTTSSNSISTASTPEQFINEAEKKLEQLNLKASRASWVQENFITQDTEALSADANKDVIAATTELATAARKFDGQKMSEDTARKFKLLKLSLVAPAPSNPEDRDKLTKIAAAMSSAYGSGKYCPDGEKGKCQNLDELSATLVKSRNPEELKKAWMGWHSVAGSHKDDYAKFVELSNKGAVEMGFKDSGSMWRSNCS